MSSLDNRKIQRLPALLLAEEKEENDYYPKVVSIGPYHHGKTELAQVEAFKPMAVELLVRNPEEKESLYQQVLGMIGEVRNCYEGESVTNYSDDYLAQMMLQDASLIIIEMVLSIQLDVMGDGQQLRAWNAMIEHLGRLTIATLFRDFFLVDNQVPLGVLELLIRLLYGDGIEVEMIYRYLNRSIFGEERRGENFSVPPPLHLLEVMHRVLVSDCVEVAPEETSCNGCVVRLFSPRNEATENWATKQTHSFRTVTDLKAKGIHFRPSATRSLKDVGFKSGFFYATLRLPGWFMSPYSKPFFKNLVAYELLPGILTDPVVVSYVDLMQSLVERAEDVKELRESRILYHQLGSDEEILNVYKSINNHGASSSAIFARVKDRIQVHYNSRTNTWMAELIHTYFRSPWTLIAFLAATTVIVLTAAQLYYAIPNANKGK